MSGRVYQSKAREFLLNWNIPLQLLRAFLSTIKTLDRFVMLNPLLLIDTTGLNDLRDAARTVLKISFISLRGIEC